MQLILTEIKETECYIANSDVDKLWTDRLKPLWYRYHIGQSSIVSAASASIEGLTLGTVSALNEQVWNDAIAWAQEVKESAFADLDSIHAALVGLYRSYQSAMTDDHRFT